MLLFISCSADSTLCKQSNQMKTDTLGTAHTEETPGWQVVASGESPHSSPLLVVLYFTVLLGYHKCNYLRRFICFKLFRSPLSGATTVGRKKRKSRNGKKTPYELPETPEPAGEKAQNVKMFSQVVMPHIHPSATWLSS